MSHQKNTQINQLTSSEIKKLIHIQNEFIRFRSYFQSLCKIREKNYLVDYDCLFSFYSTFLSKAIKNKNSFNISNILSLEVQTIYLFDYLCAMSGTKFSVCKSFLLNLILMLSEIKTSYYQVYLATEGESVIGLSYACRTQISTLS